MPYPTKHHSPQKTPTNQYSPTPPHPGILTHKLPVTEMFISELQSRLSECRPIVLCLLQYWVIVWAFVYSSYIYSYLQLLRMFFRQQDELRRLKDELAQKDIKIRQLELELNNLRNSPNINNRNNNNNSSDNSM